MSFENATSHGWGLFTEQEIKDHWWISRTEGIDRAKTSGGEPYRRICLCGGLKPLTATHINAQDAKEWLNCPTHHLFNKDFVRKLTQKQPHHHFLQIIKGVSNG